MKFKERSLREIAEIVVGDVDYFPYRSSSYITRFFEECELDYVHDGSTRWRWASDLLSELLEDPPQGANTLPERFVHVLRVLMDKEEAEEESSERLMALEALNKPLNREGMMHIMARMTCFMFDILELKKYRSQLITTGHLLLRK